MTNISERSSLSKTATQWYWVFRVVLFAFFVGLIGWVLIKTIFPNGGGYFDFKSYGSGKNTLADPRYDNGDPVERGVIKKGGTMTVNASASGGFSKAQIDFDGTFSSQRELGVVTITQAYRAYFYPLGDPVVCPREGTLISLNGKYGIVSQKKIRYFLSQDDIAQRGYRVEQFQVFSPEGIRQCPLGEGITKTDQVVLGMIVRTDDGFFQFTGSEWNSFVSEAAFHSRYRDEDASTVSPETFAQYPVSETRIGYLDGTVVSYGESVYVVEGDTLRPVDSPDTFLAKGYIWEEVVPLNGEEFGIYTRGKLYTKREPHPSGTVFLEQDTNNMYLVEGRKRREVTSLELRTQFSSIRAIPASAVELGSCSVRSGWLGQICNVDWSKRRSGVGAEYQLVYVSGADVQLNSMEVTFFREKNARNWWLFVADTMSKLRSRYPFLQ